MLKTLTVFGTRPEAIKMAPLIKELEKSKNIQSVVCVTGQHREMLDQVLNIFKINPDYDLDIMKKIQTITSITSSVLERFDKVIKNENPDVVLVHGDTTTTFSASLAAFYNKVKVGHVEAGLRTLNKYFPYPEEMNRKLTGCIADFHFCPTLNNKNNLLAEGINDKQIYLTGNTVIDALKTTVRKEYTFVNQILNNLDYEGRKIILVTAHRRENLGKPLENICDAILEIAREYKDTDIVYPVHLNPAVRETVFNKLKDIDNIYLIDPVDVLELHNLMDRCYCVLTDSGGLQEEAPSLGKPVLVLRNETERPEAVDAGTVKIAGVDKNNIIRLTRLLLSDKEEYAKMAKAVNPYGDGYASEKIVKTIKDL